MDKGHGKYTVHDRNDAPCVMGTYPIRHTPDRQKLKLTEARLRGARGTLGSLTNPHTSYCLDTANQPIFGAFSKWGQTPPSCSLSLSLSAHRRAPRASISSDSHMHRLTASRGRSVDRDYPSALTLLYRLS